MKKLFFLTVLTLTLGLTHAQDVNSDPETLFREAMAFHQSGNYFKAIENYSQLLKFDLDSEIKRQILIKRGLANNSALQYDSALMDFTEAIKLDSTDMASFVDRALTNYYKQDFDNAEIDFKYVREKNTDKKMTENSIYWLTKIEFNRGNFQKAISYCDELINANKNDAEFYFLRGTAYSNLQNYDEAIKDYDDAVKIFPNYVEAITNRGVAKINKLTTNGNFNPSKKETKSACEDLKNANKLGDKKNTEDLIYVYCK